MNASTRIREYETNSTSQVQRVNSFSFLASALCAVLCCVIDECCIFWTQREVAVAVAVGGWLHCVALMRHWPFVWPDNEPASCTEHGHGLALADWVTVGRPVKLHVLNCQLHSMTPEHFNRQAKVLMANRKFACTMNEWAKSAQFYFVEIILCCFAVLPQSAAIRDALCGLDLGVPDIVPAISILAHIYIQSNASDSIYYHK